MPKLRVHALTHVARRLRRRPRPDASSTRSASGASACTTGCSRPAPGTRDASASPAGATASTTRFAAGASSASAPRSWAATCSDPSAGRGRRSRARRGAGGGATSPLYHHPVFVLTHHAHDPIEMEGGTTFHFVTDGIESALEQARAAAGERRHPPRRRRGRPCASTCAPGLIDDLHLAISPLLLGAGERLFDDDLGDAIDRYECVEMTRRRGRDPRALTPRR